MFILKKIVAPFFLPMPICFILLTVGLFLVCFSRKQKTGKIILSAGIVLLFFFSYGIPSNMIATRLEYQYPPLFENQDIKDVKVVVVLGGGHTSDDRLPAMGQIGPSSLSRLVEGIRIHRLLDNSKLVLSGGSGFDPVPNAKVMARVALDLGVTEKELILESESKDTKDQALLLKETIGNGKFVLVTSATHLPRSMALFKKLGMQPIPAPTDYTVKESEHLSPDSFFPGAENIIKVERAIHEYLGMIWAKIRGQI
jgi:uncharacterized SAM-binding protein YcdF (DUF218 family)